MSSVGKPGDVYKNIAQALIAGNRIIFDKTTREFKAVDKDAFKKTYQKNKQYATGLLELQVAITDFIQEHGITDPQKQELQQAFEQRAASLEGKFFAFLGGDALKKAASELRGFEPIIGQAQRIHQQHSAIPKNVPPSTPGPQI